VLDLAAWGHDGSSWARRAPARRVGVVSQWAAVAQSERSLSRLRSHASERQLLQGRSASTSAAASSVEDQEKIRVGWPLATRTSASAAGGLCASADRALPRRRGVQRAARACRFDAVAWHFALAATSLSELGERSRRAALLAERASVPGISPLLSGTPRGLLSAGAVVVVRGAGVAGRFYARWETTEAGSARCGSCEASCLSVPPWPIARSASLTFEDVRRRSVLSSSAGACTYFRAVGAHAIVATRGALGMFRRARPPRLSRGRRSREVAVSCVGRLGCSGNRHWHVGRPSDSSQCISRYLILQRAGLPGYSAGRVLDQRAGARYCTRKGLCLRSRWTAARLCSPTGGRRRAP